MKRYRYYIQSKITGQVYCSGTCVESQVPALRDEASDYTSAELILNPVA